MVIFVKLVLQICLTKMYKNVTKTAEMKQHSSKLHSDRKVNLRYRHLPDAMNSDGLNRLAEKAHFKAVTRIFWKFFYCCEIYCALFWAVTGLADENGVGQNARPETETKVCR